MRQTWAFLVVGLVLWTEPNTVTTAKSRWTNLGLTDEHVPYFFFNNPEMKTSCEEDPKCPYKHLLEEKKCWGYEKNCPEKLRMSPVNCQEDGHSWTKTKKEQQEMFWNDADFGFISKRLSSMKTFCKGQGPEDSSLSCSDDTRHCIGKNIYIDLSKAGLTKRESARYRNDLLPEKGLIGGNCKLNKAILQKEGDHKSFLQSWASELEHFTEFDFHPIKDKKCDVVFHKPTVLFKLDAGINMYHHFCDYVNLYMSQHMNNTFSKDITIINWDSSSSGTYYDPFSATWDAFTSNPILMLQKYAGKKVCFKDVMFPLLARQRRGLYYNTPIVPGCAGSNMFRAFSHHVLHRLGVKQHGPLESKIRVTMLIRKTKYRQILNEEELTKALKMVGEYELNVVEYRDVPFVEQLATTLNSDVFMGIHGAGLTHFLFQPDWGASFEIYNCEDRNCYKDLARLRGTKYFTWENHSKLEQEDEGHHPQLGAHAKFTNYSFDVTEFMRMVAKNVAHVKEHPAFKAAWEAKYKRTYPGGKDEL